MRVSAEDARRFLVARHALTPARSLAGREDGVLEVFRRLGSVQFDPLAVAGRSHDLVLHARVAGYDIRVNRWCVLRPALGLGAARVTAVITVEGESGDDGQTGAVVSAGAEALFAWEPAFLGLEARYTAFYVDTAPLEDIPGLEIDDSARLDGLLFAVKGGIHF